MPDTETKSNPFAAPVESVGTGQLDIGTEEGEAYDDSSELPPPGIYPSRCIYAERTNAKSSGNPMIVFTYMITDPEAYNGTEVTDRVMLTGKMKFMLGRVLAAFGIEARGKTSVDLSQVVNANVNLKIKHEEWDGRPMLRVEQVLKHEVTSGTASAFRAPNSPTEDIPF